MIRVIKKGITSVSDWMLYSVLSEKQKESLKNLFTEEQKEKLKELTQYGRKHTQKKAVKHLRDHLYSLGFTQQALTELKTWYQKERSEEHTSELQSRGHLVCRLLLAKKKTSR